MAEREGYWEFGPVSVRQVVAGPLRSNAYILVDHQEGVAAVIDPVDDAPKLLGALKEEGDPRVEAILATHGHFDHVMAAKELRTATGAPFLISEREVQRLKEAKDRAAIYMGIIIEDPAEPDGQLEDGQELQVGSARLQAIDTQGHSRGDLSFLLYLADSTGPVAVFSGDTLFAGSIGRTDRGGSMMALMASIEHRLLTLPDDTLVLSGHGPSTTIGKERQENPFLQSLKQQG